MSTTSEVYPGPLHPRPTRNGLQYFFYDKHHRGTLSNDAQWLSEPELTHQQEFDVFDEADFREFRDTTDNLYGVRPRNADGSLLSLGTRGEQVARFPFTTRPRAWHGYPIWPIEIVRDGERLRPIPKLVLERMVQIGVINDTERRRLQGGKHA